MLPLWFFLAGERDTNRVMGVWEFQRGGISETITSRLVLSGNGFFGLLTTIKSGGKEYSLYSKGFWVFSETSQQDGSLILIEISSLDLGITVNLANIPSILKLQILSPKELLIKNDVMNRKFQKTKIN